jgi:hypothetical protein
MLTGHKRRTVALIAVLILGLIVVAVPVCSAGVCDMAVDAMASSGMPSGMVGSVAHAMSDPMTHAVAGVTAAAGRVSSTMTPAFRAVCTMTGTITAVVDRALAGAGQSLLLSLFGMLAVAALFLGSAPVPMRLQSVPAGESHSPPDDIRGVRLLN